MSVPTEVRLGGAHPLRGSVRVPGDKSISHRAYLFAAMATGRSRLENLGGGDDVHATRRALEGLGVHVRPAAGGAVNVSGVGVDGLSEPGAVIDCANAGTCLRLLAGLLAGRPFHSVLTGDASLCRRPMGRVVNPLRAVGAAIDGRDGGRLAPLSIRGGGLVGMRHTLEVASAQVKSALVLAGLQSSGTTEIVEPGQSRDHTERMLGAFGAPVEVRDGVVRVSAGAPRPFDLSVPGDPSSAAFLVVAATITPDSEILIEGVDLNPTRLGFVAVLRRMGASIDVQQTGESGGEPVGDLSVRYAALTATVVEGDEVPAVIDEIPVLAVAAAFADGVTEFRDAAELRVKESDRIGTVEQELTQLGVHVEQMPDGLVITGGRPRSGTLKSHGDHRIALAAAVAAHAVSGESTVRGFGAATVSYPGFLDDLAALTGEQST